MPTAQRAIDRAVKLAGSQQKLADMIGVTQSQVSHWVSGAPVHQSNYQAIETATGVTAHELLADAMAKVKPRKKVRRKLSKREAATA